MLIGGIIIMYPNIFDIHLHRHHRAHQHAELTSAEIILLSQSCQIIINIRLEELRLNIVTFPWYKPSNQPQHFSGSDDPSVPQPESHSVKSGWVILNISIMIWVLVIKIFHEGLYIVSINISKYNQ